MVLGKRANPFHSSAARLSIDPFAAFKGGECESDEAGARGACQSGPEDPLIDVLRCRGRTGLDDADGFLLYAPPAGAQRGGVLSGGPPEPACEMGVPSRGELDISLRSEIAFRSTERPGLCFSDQAMAESVCRASGPASSLLGRLTYYEFPGTVLPQSVLKALRARTANRDEQAFLEQTLNGWRTVFTGLYRAYSTGLADAFYYQQGDLSAAFVKEGAEPAVYLNHSVYSLRKRLREEGIEYRLACASTQAAESEQCAESGEAEAAVRVRRKNTVAIDQTPLSALMIRGQRNVHFLFDFLLNQSADRPAFALPSLISQGPFLGSTVRQCTVCVSASVSAAVSKAELPACFRR